MFYTSLPFIVVARCGYILSLEKLIAKEKDCTFDTVIHFSLSIGAIGLVHLLGIALCYVIKEWLKRFGIPTLCMAMATPLFSTGFCSYRRGITKVYIGRPNVIKSVLLCFTIMSKLSTFTY